MVRSSAYSRRSYTSNARSRGNRKSRSNASQAAEAHAWLEELMNARYADAHMRQLSCNFPAMPKPAYIYYPHVTARGANARQQANGASQSRNTTIITSHKTITTVPGLSLNLPVTANPNFVITLENGVFFSNGIALAQGEEITSENKTATEKEDEKADKNEGAEEAEKTSHPDGLEDGESSGKKKKKKKKSNTSLQSSDDEIEKELLKAMQDLSNQEETGSTFDGEDAGVHEHPSENELQNELMNALKDIPSDEGGCSSSDDETNVRQTMLEDLEMSSDEGNAPSDHDIERELLKALNDIEKDETEEGLTDQEQDENPSVDQKDKSAPLEDDLALSSDGSSDSDESDDSDDSDEMDQTPPPVNQMPIARAMPSLEPILDINGTVVESIDMATGKPHRYFLRKAEEDTNDPNFKEIINDGFKAEDYTLDPITGMLVAYPEKAVVEPVVLSKPIPSWNPHELHPEMLELRPNLSPSPDLPLLEQEPVAEQQQEASVSMEAKETSQCEDSTSTEDSILATIENTESADSVPPETPTLNQTCPAAELTEESNLSSPLSPVKPVVSKRASKKRGRPSIYEADHQPRPKKLRTNRRCRKKKQATLARPEEYNFDDASLSGFEAYFNKESEKQIDVAHTQIETTVDHSGLSPESKDEDKLDELNHLWNALDNHLTNRQTQDGETSAVDANGATLGNKPAVKQIRIVKHKCQDPNDPYVFKYRIEGLSDDEDIEKLTTSESISNMPLVFVFENDSRGGNSAGSVTDVVSKQSFERLQPPEETESFNSAVADIEAPETLDCVEIYELPILNQKVITAKDFDDQRETAVISVLDKFVVPDDPPNVPLPILEKEEKSLEETDAAPLIKKAKRLNDTKYLVKKTTKTTKTTIETSDTGRKPKKIILVEQSTLNIPFEEYDKKYANLPRNARNINLGNPRHIYNACLKNSNDGQNLTWDTVGAEAKVTGTRRALQAREWYEPVHKGDCARKKKIEHENLSESEREDEEANEMTLEPPDVESAQPENATETANSMEIPQENDIGNEVSATAGLEIEANYPKENVIEAETAAQVEPETNTVAIVEAETNTLNCSEDEPLIPMASEESNQTENEKVSEAVPEKVSEEEPEKDSETVPEKVSDKVSEKEAEKVAETSLYSRYEAEDLSFIERCSLILTGKFTRDMPKNMTDGPEPAYVESQPQIQMEAHFDSASELENSMSSQMAAEYEPHNSEESESDEVQLETEYECQESEVPNYTENEVQPKVKAEANTQIFEQTIQIPGISETEVQTDLDLPIIPNVVPAHQTEQKILCALATEEPHQAEPQPNPEVQADTDFLGPLEPVDLEFELLSAIEMEISNLLKDDIICGQNQDSFKTTDEPVYLEAMETEAEIFTEIESILEVPLDLRIHSLREQITKNSDQLQTDSERQTEQPYLYVFETESPEQSLPDLTLEPDEVTAHKEQVPENDLILRADTGFQIPKMSLSPPKPEASSAQGLITKPAVEKAEEVVNLSDMLDNEIEYLDDASYRLEDFLQFRN